LPNGYTLFGVVNDQIVTLPPDGGGGRITCTCKDGGGCKPIKYKDRVGCEVSNCNSCEAKTSIKLPNGTLQPLDFFFIQYGKKLLDNIEDEVLENIGFTPIKTPQEWIELPFLTPDDIQNHEFKEKITEMNKIFEDEKIDRNSYRVGVLLKARDKNEQFKKGILIVPHDAVLSSPGILVVGLPIATWCSGSCKEGSCTKSGSIVVTCTGCDSGCTLHY